MSTFEFPVVFESYGIKVYHNSSDEVFIKHKQTGITVRIGDGRDDLHITAHGCNFMPDAFNGLGGFRVTKK